MMEDYKGGKLRRQFNEKEVGFAWGALCFTCSPRRSFWNSLLSCLLRYISLGPPLASLAKFLCLFEVRSSSSSPVHVHVQVSTLVSCSRFSTPSPWMINCNSETWLLPKPQVCTATYLLGIANWMLHNHV